MAGIGDGSFPKLVSASFFLFLLLAVILPENFLTDAQQLPADEIAVLKAIGNKLGKSWNFGVNPCSGGETWTTPSSDGNTMNNVTCDCTFNNQTVCHVISIQLKSQNLTGVLPSELSNLTHLTVFDVSRNYLNGTIPASWGSLPLVNLSLMANRLSGGIPKELGNISTLQRLVVEANQLEGTIPPELGNLSRIKRLYVIILLAT